MSSIDAELHVENLLADCSILTTEETGAYTLLLFHWLEYDILLLDDARRISRIDVPKWVDIWQSIAHLFDASKVNCIDHEGFIESKVSLTPNRIAAYLKEIDRE